MKTQTENNSDLEEKLTKVHKSTEARVQRTAIMEALGMKPKEMTKALGVHKQSTYNYRMKAHEGGQVEELQGKMTEKAVSLLDERRILATRCLEIANKKAFHIASKNPEDIKLREADFALKALGETEHSGKKVNAPEVVINVKKEATLNIQQNLADIDRILERSGINLDALVGVI